MQNFTRQIAMENVRGDISLFPTGTVAVYEAGTDTLASIFEEDGTTPKTNPVTADSNAIVEFSVANGTYDFVFSNSVSQIREDGVVAFDPGEPFDGKAGQEQTGTIATVVTCNTSMPVDDSIPQNTEGTEVVTVSITPEKADSMIEITYEASGSATGTMFVSGAVFKDATASALTGSTSMEQSTGSNQKFQLGWSLKVAAGSTAARTYKLRVGPSGSGTAYVNGDSAGNRLMGGAQVAKITAREVFA